MGWLLLKREHNRSLRKRCIDAQSRGSREHASRWQATVENGAAHFLVERTRQGRMRRAFVERQFQAAGVS